MDILRSISDEFNFVMIFGHNPGITVFSNSVSDKYIDNIPTAAYALMEFDVDSWNEIKEDSARIISFEYPKKYFT